MALRKSVAIVGWTMAAAGWVACANLDGLNVGDAGAATDASAADVELRDANGGTDVALIDAISTDSESDAGARSDADAAGDVASTDSGRDASNDGAQSTADAADADAAIPCAGGVCPEILASGESGPDNLAFDGVNLFWSTYDGNNMAQVATCVASSCAGTRKALLSGLSAPRGLAVRGGFVYATDGSRVLKCATTGCANTPTVLADNQLYAMALTVDANNAYWVTSTDNAVRRCAVGGCSNTPTTLASGQNEPRGIVVDATNVYWTDHYAAAVKKCAIAGCSNAPTTLASGSAAGGGTLQLLAVDATNAYWTTDWTVMKCALSSCDSTAAPLVTGVVEPYGIAVDATNVYYAAFNGGQIASCAIGGCGNAPKVLADNRYQPNHVLVDATYVYWTEGGGGFVLRHAK